MHEIPSEIPEEATNHLDPILDTRLHTVVKEADMRMGPYMGYYGRAFWSDVTQKFEGWLICPDRVKFNSRYEEDLQKEFQEAVECYVSEEEICV